MNSLDDKVCIRLNIFYFRSGVDAVINDVKGVQKDINNLNGVLERTFIEITLTMKNRINNKEPYIEQGLMLTRRIHESCYQITETIRWQQ